MDSLFVSGLRRRFDRTTADVACRWKFDGNLLATAPGQAEVHTRATDVIYVVEGTATFVTGGRPIDPENVA